MAALHTRDITPTFGTEIEGLDLSGELDRDTVVELRRLFDERSVLVVHADDLSPADQQYLAGLLVDDEAPADRAAAEGAAHLYPTRVSNRDANGNAPYGRLLFHSDMMWGETPPQLLSLYGSEVEQPSVPTVFVSTTRAWATLPDDLRARVEGRSAVHQTGQAMRGDDVEENLEQVREMELSVTKPVANLHPRTGQTLLYVGQMNTREIVGIEPEASEMLLQELFDHLYDEAHAYEHVWRQGDLVVWDNLALQHGRPTVHLEGPARTLRKVLAPKSTTKVPDAALPRFNRAG